MAFSSLIFSKQVYQMSSCPQVKQSFTSNRRLELNLLLSLFILSSLIGGSQQTLYQTSVDQQIVQIQNFSQLYLIEQNEIEQFELQEYFWGALLQYDYDVRNLDTPWFYPYDEGFYKYMIIVTKPYQSMGMLTFSNDTFTKNLEPFPDSSVLVPSQDGTTLMLYFLDRNFDLWKFDVSYFDLGQMKELWKVRLNTTIINESCHDLTYINQPHGTEGLLLFCRSMVLDLTGDIDHYLYSTVFVNLTHLDPKTKLPTIYYNQFYTVYAFLDKEVSFMGWERTDDETTVALFLANERPAVAQCVIRVNISEFTLMMSQNISYQYNQYSTIQQKVWFSYINQQQGALVTHLQVLSYNPMIVGFVMDQIGVMLCIMKDDIFDPQKPNQYFAPPYPCNSPSTSQFLPMSNALSLNMNPQDSSHFFITLSFPPGVVEVNIEDPFNVYVFKTYQLPNESPTYIGTPVVATNQNLIIHSMFDLERGQQVLRVYNRNQSHYNIAKCNYILQSRSKSNFIYFPSYYQNYLLYRDEVRLNSTLFNDAKLVLNATFATLTYIFKNNRLQVNLTASNGHNSLNVVFNVQFVQNDFTQVVLSAKGQQDQEIFYNCGDDQFQYQISDLFDGPNYNLSIIKSKQAYERNPEEGEEDECKEGECFFDIVNENMQLNMTITLDDLQCDSSFIYMGDPPTQDTYGFYRSDQDDDTDKSTVLLICIDNVHSLISSYDLNTKSDKLIPLNQIIMPSLQFVFVGADPIDRSLFVIAEVTNQEDWVQPNNEVHFFEIQEEIVWKNFTFAPIQVEGVDLSNFTQFAYNPNNNRGVLATAGPQSLIDKGQQILLYFDVDPENTVFTIMAQLTLEVDISNSPFTSVAISEEGFVFALSSYHYLSIYSIDELDINGTTNYYFVRLRQRYIGTTATPLRMDIHQTYFLLYFSPNIVQVYDIKNYIDLDYRMQLPLYIEYGNYQFCLNASSPTNILNSYYNGFLALLLVNKNTTTQSISVKLFFFSIGDFQHNTLVMVNDVTDFFDETMNRMLVLSGNEQQNIIILMSEGQLQLHSVQFFNYIVIKNDVTLKKKLLDLCSKHKYEVNSQGILVETPIQVATLTLQGISMFDQNLPAKYSIDGSAQSNEWYSHQSLKFKDGGNTVKLNVLTQNQGLAVTPTDNYQQLLQSQRQKNRQLSAQKGKIPSQGLNDDNQNDNGPLEIYFAFGDEKVGTMLEDYFLIVENLVEGFNMNFSLDCSYFDKNGEVLNCTEGVTDLTNSETYNFYIEFVTQNRQIIKSFSLGNMFIMFDTLNMISVQTLQGDGTNLDSINGQALEFLKDYRMEEQLKCNVSTYINVYRCLFYDDQTVYLAIYQCKIDQSLSVKMAKITINSETDDFSITVLEGGFRLPYKVLSIDRSNITLTQNGRMLYDTIGLSADNPQSTSNLFYVINVTINLDGNWVLFEADDIKTARVLDSNTFKIGQLLTIPGSDIIIIVDSLYGIYLYDLDLEYVLRSFDMRQDDLISDLTASDLADFTVFTVAGNWPYQIHIITNVGIFIYNFQVNLCDKTEVFPDFYENLTPVQRKIIRYKFDSFDSEIAANPYGYAFLMSQINSSPSGIQYSETYLGVVSFYGSSTSKFFKLINVANNQKCQSLNLEEDLLQRVDNSVISDELMVSFVCNTQLYIVKTRLRPSYQINMKAFLSNSTRLKNGRYQPGALQFNQYNLTLTASNQYSLNGLNQAVVNITLFQKTYPNSQYPEFYLICVFVLITVVTLIMLLAIGGKNGQNQGIENYYEEHQIPKMSFIDQGRASTQANHSSFVPSASHLGASGVEIAADNNQGKAIENSGGKTDSKTPLIKKIDLFAASTVQKQDKKGEANTQFKMLNLQSLRKQEIRQDLLNSTPPQSPGNAFNPLSTAIKDSNVFSSQAGWNIQASATEIKQQNFSPKNSKRQISDNALAYNSVFGFGNSDQKQFDSGIVKAHLSKDPKPKLSTKNFPKLKKQILTEDEDAALEVFSGSGKNNKVKQKLAFEEQEKTVVKNKQFEILQSENKPTLKAMKNKFKSHELH